jgi:hypothetical protein
VHHTVTLRRPLSDREWRRLADELRITFDADGRERAEGARREWRSGNLRVLHEPVAQGAYLSLRSERHEAPGLNLFAATGALSALAVLWQVISGTGHLDGLGAMLLPLMGGIAGVVWTATRLGEWARQRAAEFEVVGRFAQGLAERATPAEARNEVFNTVMDVARGWLFGTAGRGTRNEGGAR